MLLASKGDQILDLFGVEQIPVVRAAEQLSFPFSDPMITPEAFEPFPGVIKGSGTV